MSAERCSHCERVIDTDTDDTGDYNGSLNYICGACLEGLREDSDLARAEFMRDEMGKEQ